LTTPKTVWQGIYKQQLELLGIDDIGQAAKAQVCRDVEKAVDTLIIRHIVEPD
jgi:hypothetical protein